VTASLSPTAEPEPVASRTMPLRGSEAPLAEVYDTALLDLDGVVYVGPAAVPGAPAALAAARARGMRLAYVTNNAARTPAMVASHLTELGVPAQVDEVVTSAQAAASLVAQRVAPGAAVLVVGGAGLVEAVRERGLRPVTSADEEPEAVVQGFAPEVSWTLLAEGAYAVRAGAPWIASNLDLTIPTPRGVAPGNGSLVNVIATATGRRPDAVAGKPELALHREAMQRSGARRALVVGDRLDTDIEGATRADTDSLLVLTGVTGARELLTAPPEHRPTFVAATMQALLEPLPPVERQPDGRWVCRGWRAAVTEGVLVLHPPAGEESGSSSTAAAGADSLDDALRAACAAVWVTAPDAAPAVDVDAALRQLPE
jgi:glycerol 3-phosphatase-2